MGAFDKSLNEYERFGEKFNVGDSFIAESLRVGPTIPTEYGDSPTFIIAVGGVEYAGFGLGIVGQARAQEDGDFPSRVTLALRPTTKGNMKVLVPADPAAAAAVAASGVVTEGAAEDDIPF